MGTLETQLNHFLAFSLSCQAQVIRSLSFQVKRLGTHTIGLTCDLIRNAEFQLLLSWSHHSHLNKVFLEVCLQFELEEHRWVGSVTELSPYSDTHALAIVLGEEGG